MGWGENKNCAVGHNEKARGTRGRFYRGKEWEQGRLVDTSHLRQISAFNVENKFDSRNCFVPDKESFPI